MIVNMLSLILFLIFTFLSSIHVYWAFGGRWGVEEAIPTKENGTHSLKPPPIATLVVAAGLMIFAVLYALKTDYVNLDNSHRFYQISYWFIPSIFLLRAIGEFNYVGLFKKVKGTTFAKADTKIFIPLCLSIGLIGILIQVLN